jgi:hypothetical protein
MSNPLSTTKTILYKASGTVETVTSKSGVFTFGTIAPGETSNPIIVTLRVPDVDAMGNIKIALIDTGDITFSDSIFGVTSSAALDFNIIPTSYFEGVNTDDSSTNQYNIAIDSLDIHTSKYVYLNIALPRNNLLEPGVIRYKWYFDYAT